MTEASNSAKIKDVILIIKHGALGDFIMATGVFSAIKKAHPYQSLILLTTKKFAPLAKQMPYFSEVWCDDRPKFRNIQKFFKTWSMINGFSDSRRIIKIFDVQNSKRTALYHKLMIKKTPWFGHAKGCTYPRPFPGGQYHVIESFQRHFQSIGIEVGDYPELDWLAPSNFTEDLPNRFALIVPSCSPKSTEKHWSKEGFSEVIDWLTEQEIIPIVVGTSHDSPQIDPILKICKHRDKIINRINNSPLSTLVALSRRCTLSLGLDTGPMHLIAAGHQPSITLFNSSNKANLCHPCGKNAYTLIHQDLKSLPAKKVIETIKKTLKTEAIK